MPRSFLLGVLAGGLFGLIFVGSAAWRGIVCLAAFHGVSKAVMRLVHLLPGPQFRLINPLVASPLTVGARHASPLPWRTTLTLPSPRGRGLVLDTAGSVWCVEERCMTSVDEGGRHGQGADGSGTGVRGERGGSCLQRRGAQPCAPTLDSRAGEEVVAISLRRPCPHIGTWWRFLAPLGMTEGSARNDQRRT